MGDHLAMISPRLKAYLALERQMLELGTAGDPVADLLREAMDPLWYGLTDEEHEILDARIISTASTSSLRSPVGSSLFLAPPRPPNPRRRRDPVRVSGWECAA
jgi:hypothetical protein